MDGWKYNYRYELREDGPQGFPAAVFLNNQLVFWAESERAAQAIVYALGDGLKKKLEWLENQVNRKILEMEARERLESLPDNSNGPKH